MTETPHARTNPDGSPKRVYIETYGCQMNVADTELMYGGLRKSGYDIAEKLDEADVVLLNTCAVREKAEERIYGRASQLLRFKYTNPDLILGVTGCMAEHIKEKIFDRAPYVDLVVGPDAYRRLPELISQAGLGDPIIDVRLDKAETYEGMTPSRGEGVSGWISIQRGCDKFCTFCIVPYTRGRERGTAPREILRQAHELANMGYREVTLLGQTVNSYRYEDIDFADLLRSVAAVPGLDRVRYTSPYPIDFSSKLIDTLAELDNVPNYLHLPVQSGDDDILSHMRRGYTVQQFRDIVSELREKMPDLAISTDIIVGYPDETEEQYQRTLDLVSEIEFDFAFMFAYSEREGTLASKKIPDTIPADVKQRRLAALIAMQEKIGLTRYQRRVDQTVEVLVTGEARKKDGNWIGKSEDFKTVVFTPPEDIAVGQLLKVKISHCTAHTLFGNVMGSAR
ncbi:MAG: tRNA-2-methylthio-N6-dimethylallyladenosine synthase [Flavobacteriales bacterium]|jgi:tRNA-2-methylthio-N6-dimethylallyladenosine synthase